VTGEVANGQQAREATPQQASEKSATFKISELNELIKYHFKYTS